MKTFKMMLLIVAGVILSCCNLLFAQTPYNVIEDTLRRNAFTMGTCFINAADSEVEGIYADATPFLYKLDSNLNIAQEMDIHIYLDRSVYNTYLIPLAVINNKYYCIREEVVSVDDNNTPLQDPYTNSYLFVADMNSKMVTEKLLFIKNATSPYYNVYGLNRKDSTFNFQRGNIWLIYDTLGNPVKKDTLSMPGKVYHTEGFGYWTVENHIDYLYGPQYKDFFYSKGITLLPIDLDSMRINYADSVRFDIPYMWISALNRTINLLHQIDDTTMVTIVDSLKYDFNYNSNQLSDLVVNVLNLSTGQRDAKIVLAEVPWNNAEGKGRTVKCSADGIAYENRDSIYMCFIGMSDVYDVIDHYSLYITCFSLDGTVHFVKPYQLDFVTDKTTFYNMKVINGNLYMWIGNSVLKYSPKGKVVDTSGASNPDDGSSLMDVTSEMTTVIYPNPAKNNITVLYGISESNLSFILYDINGNEILSKTLQNRRGEQTISLDKIPSGTYYYKIIGNDKTLKSDKLIIVK